MIGNKSVVVNSFIGKEMQINIAPQKTLKSNQIVRKVCIYWWYFYDFVRKNLRGRLQVIPLFRYYRIGHDDKGMFGGGWMLDNVEIEAPSTQGKRIHFPCGRWLDKKEDDGLIERELLPGDGAASGGDGGAASGGDGGADSGGTNGAVVGAGGDAQNGGDPTRKSLIGLRLS